MDFKKYVDLILQEFNLSLDVEKYNNCNFSAHSSYNDDFVSYDYILYTFSQNYPYLIFCLRNNKNKLSRQLIYVNSEPFLVEGDKNNKGEVELSAYEDVFNYEEITQIVANRIVEVFPYDGREILIKILDEIMQNFRSIAEKFIDERHSVIQNTFPNSTFDTNSYEFTLEEIGSLTELYNNAISNAIDEQREYLVEAIKYGFVAKENLLLILEKYDLKNLEIDEDTYGELVKAIKSINHNLIDESNKLDFSISSEERGLSDFYLYAIVEKVNKMMNQ